MDNLMGAFPRVLEKLHRECRQDVPSKTGAVKFLGDVVALLFPVTHGQIFSPEEIEYRWLDLMSQFRRLVSQVVADAGKRKEVTDRFFEQLPAIYADLTDDTHHFFECDPAAHCREEVVLCYPGFYAIMVHRLAHAIHVLGVPILPRILSEHAHSRTGIDIHPGATIGKRFFIDHGTGIVIGETCTIGENVKMYQGVTLGATFVKKELQGLKRHPTIEDNVILYAGCTILGGDTVVGRGAVIGGNVWLVESVAAGTKVFHKPDVG
ncbi:MAG: serine acetyltransferase [Alistipes sp.]|jgi:serine O-acetyltransferase|nr:serine acetyltransferase [Alistipes sp.]